MPQFSRRAPERDGRINVVWRQQRRQEKKCNAAKLCAESAFSNTRAGSGRKALCVAWHDHRSSQEPTGLVVVTHSVQNQSNFRRRRVTYTPHPHRRADAARGRGI